MSTQLAAKFPTKPDAVPLSSALDKLADLAQNFGGTSPADHEANIFAKTTDCLTSAFDAAGYGDRADSVPNIKERVKTNPDGTVDGNETYENIWPENIKEAIQQDSWYSV